MMLSPLTLVPASLAPNARLPGSLASKSRVFRVRAGDPNHLDYVGWVHWLMGWVRRRGVLSQGAQDLRAGVLTYVEHQVH